MFIRHELQYFTYFTLYEIMTTIIYEFEFVLDSTQAAMGDVVLLLDDASCGCVPRCATG